MTLPARILIIDDEAPIRRFLRVALEAQGHHVTEAATGRDGIEACALTTPKAVILDLGLPDMDGRAVLARLRGLLRDRSGVAPQGAALQVADLTIDATARTVLKGGTEIHLTRKEFDLLWLLASNAGRLVTQGMALEHVWGKAHLEDSHYLRVFIRQLRAKIGDDAGNPSYIFTESGVGYRFASGS